MQADPNAVWTVGDRVDFGGYGIGPMGSDLILLQTTLADDEQHEEEYEI